MVLFLRPLDPPDQAVAKTQSKFSPRPVPVVAPSAPSAPAATPAAATTTNVNSSSVTHAHVLPRALKSTATAIPRRTAKHPPKLASVVMAPSREVIHEFDPAAARASSRLNQALMIGGLGAVEDGDGTF